LGSDHRARRRVVGEYSYLITLRQLHYRPVMTTDLGYDNDERCYKRVSALTAEGRRDWSFPTLLDQTRQVDRQPSWTSPRALLVEAVEQFRLDHTEGQEWMVVLGGEKATLLAQLEAWFVRPRPAACRGVVVCSEQRQI
jgi:hypothetical protein